MVKNYGSLFAPFTKMARAVKERGWKGAIVQLYTVGDLKFGELKGTDRFGNKYYEDLDLPYGQHRWIEYADIHNFDPSNIQPEWHGWMHHVFDEVPRDNAAPAKIIPSSSVTDAIFGHHIGKIGDESAPVYDQTNVTQFRARGYNIGSLKTAANEPEPYYKQPGHALSPKADQGGRFDSLKNTKNWSPDSETK